MRHILLAIAVSATITACALTQPADAHQPVPPIAYYTAYVKAWIAGATFYDASDCTTTRCTGIYDAVAWMNGHDVYVRDTYTLKLGRDGSATALNDDHWALITKQQIADDMLARSRRRG
jgi:hypothetical protein